jgi:hypothetical protein
MIRMLAAVAAAATLLAGAALASAPPVGPLPKGPVSTIATAKGQLVAVALPHAAGKSWRIARPFDSTIVREVSEADVGTNVVVVWRAAGRGTTTIRYALTRGETAHAYASRTFKIVVR